MEILTKILYAKFIKKPLLNIIKFPGYKTPGNISLNKLACNKPKTLFFHPDFTVGPGITPGRLRSRVSVARFTAVGNLPAPKIYIRYELVHSAKYKQNGKRFLLQKKLKSTLHNISDLIECIYFLQPILS
jgi:hypothetical protein